MRNPAHQAIEKASFESFLVAHPQFATAVRSWESAQGDFPDIVAYLESGKQIDFELGEWLEPHQMAEAMRRDKLGTQVTKALSAIGSNTTKHVRFVLLELSSQGAAFPVQDQAGFRSDLLRLIAEADVAWSKDQAGQLDPYVWREFGRYPVLGRYLETVLFYWSTSTGVSQGQPEPGTWIDIMPPGGAYRPGTALEALNAVVEEKLSRYGGLRRRSRLIIHYSRGWVYNTPFRSLGVRTFREVAQFIASALQGRTVPFEKVYLLNGVQAPCPEAYEIFPMFTECG